MRLGRLAIAIVAGALVTLIVLQAQQTRLSEEDAIPVVVAAVDIPARTVLARDVLAQTTMPRRLVPPGAIASLSDAEGRLLRDPLYKGTALVDKQIAAKGADLSASLLIPPGKPYAFNLPVGFFLSAPPRLQLHDRIDIIAYPTGRPLSEGGPILTDLEIIDFTPRSADNANQSTFLTVAATSDEIVRLLAARNGQTLAIALRPFGK
ncbi:MAG TPA: SAF domain-containing protein [Candidatus Limnocylindria bacterium]